MTTFLYFFIIIYAISLAIMIIFVTLAEGWESDRRTAAIIVFVPLINTLIICVGIFYLLPSDIIQRHKEKIKQQHKDDPRWNLMNNRNKNGKK